MRGCPVGRLTPAALPVAPHAARALSVRLLQSTSGGRGSLAAALLGFLLLNCGGGGGPSLPAAPASPPPAFPPGTALTVVSGESGRPVGGASVTVAGRAYQTDASGRVLLAEATDLGAAVEINTPDFLTRQTLVRSAAATLFPLWPRATAGGLNEHYTATLVYTNTSDGAAVGAVALRRLPPSTSLVALVLAPELLVATAEHQSAADQMTAATGGRVSYSLASERPTGAGIVVFDVRIDPQDTSCNGARAFTRLQMAAGEIRGGSIVYCIAEAARSPTVAHEMGHTFGLLHSPDSQDLMGVPISRFRSQQLGPRELLVISLMLQRPSGNRFPDYDRDASGSLSTGESVIVCF